MTPFFRSGDDWGRGKRGRVKTGKETKELDNDVTVYGVADHKGRRPATEQKLGPGWAGGRRQHY